MCTGYGCNDKAHRTHLLEEAADKLDARELTHLTKLMQHSGYATLPTGYSNDFNDFLDRYKLKTKMDAWFKKFLVKDHLGNLVEVTTADPNDPAPTGGDDDNGKNSKKKRKEKDDDEKTVKLACDVSLSPDLGHYCYGLTCGCGREIVDELNFVTSPFVACTDDGWHVVTGDEEANHATSARTCSFTCGSLCEKKCEAAVADAVASADPAGSIDTTGISCQTCCGGNKADCRNDNGSDDLMVVFDNSECEEKCKNTRTFRCLPIGKHGLDGSRGGD